MDITENITSMVPPSTSGASLGLPPNLGLHQSQDNNGKRPVSSQGKRARTSDTDSDDDQPKSTAFPKFILIQNLNTEEEKVTSLSPFIIEKVIEGLIGTPKTVKKLRDNSILIETLRKGQTEQLLRQTKFYNINVRIFPHPTLNSSKGIIKDPAMKGVSEEEMKENLKSQGVTSVKRIIIKKEGKHIETNTFVLTFNTPIVPKEIKFFYRNIKIELYIPNPLRCFWCQKFGHHEDKCSAPPVCGKCGQEGNHTSTCSNPIKCANCGKDHPAYSNQCEVWLKEKEIIKLKVKNNITYPEARKLYETSINPGVNSYASIIKTKSKSVEMKDAQTQTCDMLIQSLVEEWQKKVTAKGKQATKSNEPKKTLKPITTNTASSSSTINPRNKNQSNKTSQPLKNKSPDRSTKGSSDIKLQNKYGTLEEESSMELSVDIPKPSSSSNLGSRSPVLPP